MPAGCRRSILTGIASSADRFLRCDAVASPHRNAKPGGGRMETAAVERHYGSAGIAERVLAAFRAAKGPDAPLTPEGLAPFDHFHGRGVIATQELAAQLVLQPGEHVLDIGSGIGGPARWFAAKFSVPGTRGDLTPGFFSPARALDTPTGLAARAALRHGSPLAQPV